jgi:hypothetical protein
LDDCRHQADYTGATISRFQKQAGKPNENRKNETRKSPKRKTRG